MDSLHALAGGVERRRGVASALRGMPPTQWAVVGLSRVSIGHDGHAQWSISPSLSMSMYMNIYVCVPVSVCVCV